MSKQKSKVPTRNDDDSSEEEVNDRKTASKNTKNTKRQHSDSDSDPDAKMLSKKTKGSSSNTKQQSKKRSQSDSEEDSDDVQVKKPSKKQASDDSDGEVEVKNGNNKHSKPQGGSSSEGHNELFVRNLSYTTTEDSLSHFFSSYGTVTKVKILTNRDDGRSKGIGFVEFSSNEEAKAALDDGANLNCDGR